jgi:hypothetical protein
MGCEPTRKAGVGERKAKIGEYTFEEVSLNKKYLQKK